MKTSLNTNTVFLSVYWFYQRHYRARQIFPEEDFSRYDRVGAKEMCEVWVRSMISIDIQSNSIIFLNLFTSFDKINIIFRLNWLVIYEQSSNFMETIRLIYRVNENYHFLLFSFNFRCVGRSTFFCNQLALYS